MMKTKRKIAVVTGSRAEYGLLYYLLHELKNDPEISLQIIATGMHLSPEFGMTYKLIEADGFDITAKVETLLSSDTRVGVAKSIGLGVLGFADTLNQLSPDVVVLLGDRFELLSVAQVALALKIPLAHIHGGEVTEGAIDDAIRHAITKMSHIHFVAAEPYRNRVVQMGENPDTVFKVGTLALERIARMKLLTRDEWQQRCNFELGKMNFLVTYHPVTLKTDDDINTIQSIFNALDHFLDAKVIFTKANADENGRLINLKIDEYVDKNSHRAASFVTLGDLNYISLLQFVDCVVGNSSSGLIEPSCFQKPTVNIGDRQANRLRASSVIDCCGETSDVIRSIKEALSDPFQQKLKNITSLYEKDNTAKKIKMILKNINLDKLIIKHFYDLSVADAIYS